MEPVARKTIFAGIRPKRHLVAVLTLDHVVLSDLATPCDIFGRVRDHDGQPRYDVRVCGLRRKIRSEHLTLDVPWRLSIMRQASTIIEPGIYPADRPVSEELINALRRPSDAAPV